MYTVLYFFLPPSLPPPLPSPSGVVIHTTDAEAQAASQVGHDEEELEAAQKAIPPLSELKGLKMSPLEFEKVGRSEVIRMYTCTSTCVSIFSVLACLSV